MRVKLEKLLDPGTPFLGGSIYPIGLKKQLRLQEIATRCRLPCLYVVDSGGAYLPEQANLFNEGGHSFYMQAVMASKGIPQIAYICGSCTAGAAYCGVMPSHAVIVNSLGSLYLAGPPLVKAATGEDVTAEELGGADLHCRVSGVLDYYCDDEEQGIETTRYIMNLHSDIYPAPASWNDESQAEVNANGTMNELIQSLVDPGSILHYKPMFGAGLTTQFAKLGGIKVGVIGGSGVLDATSSLKGSNFVQICEQTGIPLIFIQGYQESGSIRELSSFMRTVAIATVPRITLLTGHSKGQAYIAMNGAGLQPDLMFTWPSATISCHDDNTGEPDMDAFELASDHIADDIILPSETREVLRLSLLATSTYRNSERNCGNPVLKF